MIRKVISKVGNQLVKNGDFRDGFNNRIVYPGDWNCFNGYKSIDTDGKPVIQIISTSCGIRTFASIPTGHKALVSVTLQRDFTFNAQLLIYLRKPDGRFDSASEFFSSNDKVRKQAIITTTDRIDQVYVYGANSANSGNVKFYDVMVVDLTEIYGAGNEPTTAEQFLLDYPEYNSYVPFGGIRRKYSAITQRKIPLPFITISSSNLRQDGNTLRYIASDQDTYWKQSLYAPLAPNTTYTYSFKISGSTNATGDIIITENTYNGRRLGNTDFIGDGEYKFTFTTLDNPPTALFQDDSRHIRSSTDFIIYDFTLEVLNQKHNIIGE